jgi:hypothetical protein
VCCSEVCAGDPFCCETVWDALCTVAARGACTDTVCPGDTNSDGFVNAQDYTHVIGNWGAGTTVATADLDYSCTVDFGDLYIILTNWGECASFGACGDDDAGSCFEPGDSPYCDDEMCCIAVCDEDPFCCATNWDQSCANIASNLCEPTGVCCYPDGACIDDATPTECLGHGGLFLGVGLTCASSECPQPGACCFGSTCDDAYSLFECILAGGIFAGDGTTCEDGACGACGEPGTGDCCQPSNGPFCDDEACCEAMCEIDPFCCNVAWDELCATQAATVVCAEHCDS